MSDDWFSSKLAPDGDVIDGCHPKEAEALRDYLRQKTVATKAAQAITRPVVTAESPADDLSRLYSLLLDALVELPSGNIEPLLALIQAIETLPELDFTAIPQSKRPHDKLWKHLPNFGHLWFDVGYRSGSWKMDAEVTRAPERNALRDEHVRRAEVEARLVMAGLAGISINEAYEVVVGALESDEALLDFEVPAAAEWLVVCAKRFQQGAEKGEKSYALKHEAMSWKRWQLWEERLKELQAQHGVIQRAAKKALEAMHKGNEEQL